MNLSLPNLLKTPPLSFYSTMTWVSFSPTRVSPFGPPGVVNLYYVDYQKNLSVGSNLLYGKNSLEVRNNH